MCPPELVDTVPPSPELRPTRGGFRGAQYGSWWNRLAKVGGDRLVSEGKEGALASPREALFQSVHLLGPIDISRTTWALGKMEASASLPEWSEGWLALARRVPWHLRLLRAPHEICEGLSSSPGRNAQR